MSQEKKYQVFISSTYTDLIDARNAAINTVLESYNFPVGMEMFGADNDEQWTIIKDLIDSSDFYILIMGLMCAEIAGDFHLGDSRQPTYKNSLPFDSVS